jgi:UPF0716 family protein affecting phage T7 exclusion
VEVELKPSHYLLPHERWFAGVILERQRTHRTRAVVRMQGNYGPEGIMLMASGLATIIPGVIVALSGLAILYASIGDHSLAGIASYLMGLGAAAVVAGEIRVIQASRAGRAFRGSRPFIRS